MTLRQMAIYRNNDDIIMMSMYFGLAGRECLGAGVRKSPDFVDLVIADRSCYPLGRSKPCSQ